ncbi:MAG: hypothetical protein E7G18_02545 [Anaerococcus hydrogenalis]|uniref:hypothetical protein n=1 Tax=Anaerococcus hydrogenalis TaxID=33029 RepID=UPI0029134743|nr:hypothetical protein [Anaerococcus hydrogenalis]MDU3687556.1 hypothetical protein [Anaerococcus hydrogenalis]
MEDKKKKLIIDDLLQSGISNEYLNKYISLMVENYLDDDEIYDNLNSLKNMNNAYLKTIIKVYESKETFPIKTNDEKSFYKKYIDNLNNI